MKLFGYVVFLVLILYTSASYQKGESDLEEELNTILRNLDNEDGLAKRLPEYKPISRSQSFSDTKRHSSDRKRVNDATASTTPLLNVTIIQRGIYLARVKLNFLRNGLQDEYITGSVADGSNEIFRLQKSPTDVITYLRVRFHVAGTTKDFGDFQVKQPNGQNLCFVLSGTVFSPVYSICAAGEDYSRK